MADNKTATTSVNLSPGLSTTITNTGHLTTNTLANKPYYVTGGGGYITGPSFGGGNYANANATSISAGHIDLKGDKADVNINGVSLTDTLKAIQERLNILIPHTSLENEWAELKKLGEQYRKLEAELEEKSRMWAALKKSE